MHSLRRGGATHFFRVTGNLSATFERGRWLSVSSGRMYITEGLSILAHRKIRPATAAALRMAAEALAGGSALENAASVRGKGSSGAVLRMAVETLSNGSALENAASGHEMCPRQG